MKTTISASSRNVEAWNPAGAPILQGAAVGWKRERGVARAEMFPRRLQIPVIPCSGSAALVLSTRLESDAKMLRECIVDL